MSPRRRATLSGLAAILLWSSLAVMTAASGAVPPFQLLTLSFGLGALLGGYALLFFIDLHQVFAVALGAIVLSAGLLSVLVLRVRVLVAALVSVAALGVCFALPSWDPMRMTAGLFRQKVALPQTYAGADAFFANRNERIELLFFDDDPTSTIAVTESPGMPSTRAGIHAPPTAALLALVGATTPSSQPWPNFSGCRLIRWARP